MGKLLKQLSHSELVQELEERDLSSQGQKIELQERLELWLFRKGLNPEEHEFIDPLGRLRTLVVETRMEARLTEWRIVANLNILQEILFENMGHLMAKIECMEKKMKEITDSLRAGTGRAKIQNVRRDVENIRGKSRNLTAEEKLEMNKKSKLPSELHVSCETEDSKDSDYSEDLDEFGNTEDLEDSNETNHSEDDTVYSEGDVVYSEGDLDDSEDDLVLTSRWHRDIKRSLSLLRRWQGLLSK